MSRFTVLCFSLFAITCANGQSVCMQVISSTGSSGQNADKHFAWTVGEPVTMTFSGFARHFTQGFHQPDACLSVATDDVELAAWGIEVFPNPTAAFLQVRFESRPESRLRASIFDLMGRTLLERVSLGETGQYLFDCQQWQPGIYLLRLEDQRSKAHSTLRFVKI